MRPYLIAIIVCLVATACKSSEFKGGGAQYATGANRNGGDSSKEDMLSNSAFDDSGDDDDLGTHGSDNGDSDDDAQLDDPDSDADLGNADAPDSTVDIIRLCSNRYTEAAGTNLKASAGGAVVSLHPTPDNTNGRAVHFHTQQNANQIRKDVMNYGKFKLPLQKVRGGSYTLIVCAAEYASACKATPPTIDLSQQQADPRFGKFTASAGLYGAGIRFGSTKGVLGSGIVNVKEGKLVDVTGSFLPADKARQIEILTDKNLQDTAQTQSFLNMFAAMSGSQPPFQPLSQDEMASIQDCDESASPLVVDLGNKGLSLSEPYPGVAFDVDADGDLDHVSWPTTKENVFVALDLNGNGVVDDGGELFGNNSTGPDGQKAANGFLALAKYDDNKDRVIDAKDEVFAKLRLWADDGDGVTEAGELHALDAKGVEAIDLAYAEGLEKDAFANQTRQRSVVRLKGGLLRLIVDLWFRVL